MFLNALRNLLGGNTNKTALKKGIRRRLELLGLEERIVPATFSVLNDSDSGTGSLRQAIIDANTTAGNDTIDFNFDTGASPYTITLSSALPNIVDASTIVGTGTAGTVTIKGLGVSSLIIDANKGNFSIFSIDTGGNFFISGVTVSGAQFSGDGGAFNNSGTLTVSNSTLSGNTANNGGGIFNKTGSSLTVSNSTISGNTTANDGGGVFNLGGNLIVSNSTLSDNTSSNCGGILNTGTGTVSNSTISGNTAKSFGGGILNGSLGTLTVNNSTLSGNTAKYGGGISNNSGTLTISNSTLSDNIATGNGGGIDNSFGSNLTIINSTFSGNTANNGGGIYNNTSTLNIANTIIANSTKGGDYTGGGTVNLVSPSTAANNLVSQGTFSWATTKSSAEINLGPLANNGGSTKTMALGAGSVAIAAGDVTISNAAPVNGLDQRGFTRITSDIGAYAVSNQITVTTTSDESGHTGISLRDAITLANTAPGNDQISFNLTGTTPHTITLSSALPNIIDASAVIGSGTVGTVTITGLGDSSLTISGNKGGFSILSIDNGGNLTISGVTVTQVAAFEGPFINSGALTVNNSTISGNLALIGGGIYNLSGGTLTINNSTISGNLGLFGGGGIANTGTLTVNNSTISENTAAIGGGIANSTGSTLTVNNSTISGNKSFSYGGGIFNVSTLTVSNSTISSNSALLGGGIYNKGTLNIANTIIANSTQTTATAVTTAPIDDYFGSGIVNLIGSSTASNNLVTLDSANATTAWATTVSSAQLNLGPLQNNSGSTFTMALGAGSVAIGAGNSTVSSAAPINGLDQRGINRTTSDIGAYSFGIQVTTTADSGAGSLRQAITDANATPGNDQISFNLTGSTPYTIKLASVLPNIIDASTAITGGSAGTVSITGLGASSLTIDGNKGDFSIFAIDAGGNLFISGVTVTGANNTSTNGGAFNNLGTLAVSDSIISGNSTNQRGGGIYNENGATLTVNDSTISSNNAYYGGGIFNGVNGNTTVNNSTISSNNAYNGGGIDNHNNSASLTITNSTLSANTATKYGGAIFSNGNLTVTNSTLSGNTVSQTNSGTINTYNNSSKTYDSFYGANGGGLYLNNGTATISNSTISGNTASFTNTGNLTVGDIYAGNGGGVSIYNATVTISNSTISGNSASFTNTGKLDTKSNLYLGYGGGIFNNHGILNITNATISGNTANIGGGIYNNAALNISNTIIANSTDGASIPLNDYAASGSSVVNPASTNNIVSLDTNKSTNTWATTVPVLNLGTLANNGGPTFTIALTSSTPSSVTTGGNATISNAAPINALDQRGFARSATTPSIGSYEYYAAPTITSISPSLGIVDGGTSITITGTNFVAGPNVVTIGGVAATNVTVVDSNTITVDTPTGNLGPASVLVTTAGGTNSANTLFTFVYNTTTALTSSTNPSDFGQSVTFTATVTSSSGNPTGTVTFFDGSTNLGSVTLTSGTATLSIASLAVGSNSITAEYSGDSSFITSTSSAVTQTVNQASTTTALTSSTNPSVFGQSVTFTATVAAVSPGAGTATGTVSFFDGTTLLGNATLSSGSATLSNSSLSVGGNFSITAVYNAEDTNFLTSTSSAVSQVVNQASTTTALTSSTNPSVFGQSVTFTATVSAVSPGAGTATGTVSFFDGATLLGTGTLSAGTATLSNSSLSGGNTFSITAVYAGDSSFMASTSSVVTQTVNLGAANNPTFGAPTSTADGFTVQITNYDANLTYGGTATAGSVSISGTGLVTVTGVAANTSSTATITTTQTNYANGSGQVTATSLAPTAPLVTGTPASSSGGSSTVTLYDPVTGEETGTAVPFPGFSGAVKVVSGDFNNDGVAELIAGAGFGGGPAIAILNSQTGEVMEAFFAFDPAFTGGVFVAVQDTNGDGILDIIASAGPGGGPEVRIFDGNGLTVLRSFYAYDQSFTGGVSVASIDFNNDGILDLVTGAGPGGAPHVKVFDGATNAIISQWYAYPTTFTGGVFVAAGDIGNDGNIEVVTGAGAGGAPIVAVWDPYTGTLLAQFMAYAEDFTGGARVGINDGNTDGIADIITGAGPGGGPQVNVFNFPALDLLFSFYSGDPANTGGVFVS